MGNQVKLTAYHRPISICFVGKKLFLIFNKMFTISPCHSGGHRLWETPEVHTSIKPLTMGLK